MNYFYILCTVFIPVYASWCHNFFQSKQIQKKVARQTSVTEAESKLTRIKGMVNIRLIINYKNN